MVVSAETVAYDPNASIDPSAAEPSEAAVGVPADESDVTLDVDVTSAEDVRPDEWQDRLIEVLDVTLLATEVAADTLTQSRALRLATKYLETRNAAPALDRAKVEQWERLQSLSAEAHSKRDRSEAAQRELLDALTALLERN